MTEIHKIEAEETAEYLNVSSHTKNERELWFPWDCMDNIHN